MDIFQQIITRIIKEQASVVGPLAWDEARKVSGLRVLDEGKGDVVLSGDHRAVVNALVAQYDRLFGLASHEVSKDAVGSLLAELKPDEIPESLRQ